MTQIKRNACRICLGEGIKPIFSGPATDSSFTVIPKGQQYDRLAEKMRFVSMLPVADSSFLPNKLCYNCIVQLNTAYNFKNVIIETHMYLERVSIESGSGGLLTPAESRLQMDEDDQASITSSVIQQRPSNGGLLSQMLPPPAMSVISSLSEMSPGNNTQDHHHHHHQANGSMMSSPSSDRDECRMMDASEIKKEPLDEDLEQDRAFITRSAIRDLMAGYSGNSSSSNKRSQVRDTPTPSPSTSKTTKRMRTSDGAKGSAAGGAMKRPMVAVHNSIASSPQSDQAYLANHIVRRQTMDLRQLKPSKNKRETEPKFDISKEDLNRNKAWSKSLAYDLKHSKIMREVLENLPKSRQLRKRRTSTM